MRAVMILTKRTEYIVVLFKRLIYVWNWNVNFLGKTGMTFQPNSDLSSNHFGNAPFNLQTPSNYQSYCLVNKEYF